MPRRRLLAWVVVLIARGRTLCLPSDERRWAALPAEGFKRSARWSALDLRLWPFEYIRRAQQCHYPSERRYFTCALQKAIVYPRRKLAYLHVYKAMGTTVESFLRRICSPERERTATCAAAAEFSTESRVCSSGCTSNSTCQRRPPPFAFTFVRDPEKRFVSAYQELYQRHGVRNIGGHKRTVDYPRAFRGNLSRFFRSLIDAGHFWNAHFMPQWLFLTANQGKTKLALDYIGHVNASTPVLNALEAGLHPGNCSPGCHSCVRDHSSLRRPFKCDVPQMRGPDHRRDVHLSRAPTDGLALTREQTRTICSIYLSDYLAFGLPAPPACTDIFQRVRNGSYSLPIDFNPLQIESRSENRTVNGSKARGSGTVAWESLDWKQSLRRWLSTELNVSGTRTNPPLKRSKRLVTLSALRRKGNSTRHAALHSGKANASHTGRIRSNSRSNHTASAPGSSHRKNRNTLKFRNQATNRSSNTNAKLNISAARTKPFPGRTKRPTTAGRIPHITLSGTANATHATRTRSTTRSNKKSVASVYNRQEKLKSLRLPYRSTNQVAHANTNTQLNISVTRRKSSLRRVIPRPPIKAVLRLKNSTHRSALHLGTANGLHTHTTHTRRPSTRSVTRSITRANTHVSAH